MGSLIDQLWRVERCPCEYQACTSAIIEPNIVTGQGAISRDLAEHIVEIHNAWIKERKEEA